MSTSAPSELIQEHSAETNPVVIMSFLFLSLIIGVIIQYILSRYYPSLSYTVVLFVIGLIFGVTNAPTNASLNTSIDIWNNVDPELIIYIFLPALLVGDSMKLNIHHFKGALTASLLLAGPGVVFGTFGMGVLLKYFLPYGWSWNLCCKLFCILACCCM